jgi:cobalt-precorrin 5A hydrolase
MIVAGFGFREGASAEALMEALDLAGGRRAEKLATAADKLADAGFAALAERLGVAVVGVPPEALEAQPVETQSRAALKARGVGSVAEAAALYAAGPGGRLMAARVISGDRMATCALAEGPGIGESL